MGCILFNSSEAYDWEHAYDYCHRFENASLVEIRTEEQLEFLKMELLVLENHEGRHNWWTGATDYGREGQWYWMGSLTPVADYVWASGQPNEGSLDNCLNLETSNYNYFYLGYDVNCSYASFPICQKFI